MKKLLNIILILGLFCTQAVLAEEVEGYKNQESETIQAEQIIKMEDNKINVIVMKQPLNENSRQCVTLKRNWLGLYIQINGKVKVNPVTSTYEVQ